jgi:hypothetical protein
VQPLRRQQIHDLSRERINEPYAVFVPIPGATVHVIFTTQVTQEPKVTANTNGAGKLSNGWTLNGFDGPVTLRPRDERNHRHLPGWLDWCHEDHRAEVHGERTQWPDGQRRPPAEHHGRLTQPRTTAAPAPPGLRSRGAQVVFDPQPGQTGTALSPGDSR